MPSPKTTIWDLDPHSRAKHEILKRYLQAWMPILSHGGFPEILYIDGFAGPGVYRGGEEGSPIIALRTALNYRGPLRATMYFIFIEKDIGRAQHLNNIIKDFSVPGNFKIYVEQGKTFENAFRKHYKLFMQRLNRLPPTFAFIDPFGWVGASFDVVKAIMQHPNCEVFVNFMYEEINRFLAYEDQEANFMQYFGTDRWRACLQCETPRERNQCLHDLYMSQMKQQARIQYVRSFEMRNVSNVTDYYLFYGTNSRLGLQKMKEAMWKVDEGGEFTFSDTTDPRQMVLFERSPKFDVLRRKILEKFAGKEVTLQDIEDFVVEETPFRETHFKTQILKPLEEKELVEVVKAPDRRRKGTFSDKTMRLQFHIKN